MYYMWAGLVELVVDRSKGTMHHSQWIQPPGSFFLSRIYIHVFNVLDVYEPILDSPAGAGHSCAGWFRIEKDSLETLQDTDTTSEEGPEPEPAPDPVQRVAALERRVAHHASAQASSSRYSDRNS